MNQEPIAESELTLEHLPELRVGSLLMPDGGPINSSIKVIAINEQGFRFRKCHPSCNGEEFFMSKKALTRSHWILVPEGTQLTLSI